MSWRVSEAEAGDTGEKKEGDDPGWSTKG